MDNSKFIFTSSPKSAAELTRMGFQMLQRVEAGWLFMNNNKLFFDKLENTVYTNKMFL